MAIEDQEAKNERANNLGALNGVDLVLVSLTSTQAELDVQFFNDNSITTLLADPRPPHAVFPISGGRRAPAGERPGSVRVVAVQAGSASNALRLTVEPVGDYSTYTLSVNPDPPGLIDPIFAEIPFKFRPGCFNTDCAPEWPKGKPRSQAPKIDYLAKDYDSFRHTLIAAIEERVPGFKPTSEADFTQVLIDLFAAAGDELSDYQDRVANEAYLGSARKRVSLARHARLMDYYVHEGNQASTWLALELGPGESFVLPPEFPVWTGEREADPDAVTFLSADSQRLDAALNRLSLYTWSDARPSLAAGDTSADLAMPDETTADHVRDLIQSGAIRQLLIQEELNPRTGLAPNRDRTKRQLLRLLPGTAGARTLQDPVSGGGYLVRVRWDERDQLKHDYCFTIRPQNGGGPKVRDVSLFYGNLTRVAQGRRVELVFKPPAALLLAENEHHFVPPRSGSTNPARWGALCPLPSEHPVLYRRSEPRNEHPTESTVEVSVSTPSGVEHWEERVSLVHSEEDDRHFLVEADEDGGSVLRFGDGINGRALPADAEIVVRYQSGRGIDGNVGADKLTGFDPGWLTNRGLGVARHVSNPFDVTDGTAPESVAEILRNVGEAYRARQLRAVTLEDYVKRAEELPGVARAAARYAWTGSFRTVRLVIDPAGTERLDDELQLRIANHLEAVRLLGEDLEIRPPAFVPLTIAVRICIQADFWAEDVRYVLEQEFSDGYTPDGRAGFFHPDAWTFGQPLHRSQIEGRVLDVPGVDHVLDLSLQRFDTATPGPSFKVDVAAEEIIQVHNDPDHQELGTIEFELFGGRS